MEDKEEKKEGLYYELLKGTGCESCQVINEEALRTVVKKLCEELEKLRDRVGWIPF